MSAQEVIPLIRNCSVGITGYVPSQSDGHLVSSLVAILWSDARLADKFLGGKRDWEKEAAIELVVEPQAIKNVVGRIGRDAVVQMVAENPAGTPPSRVGFGGKPTDVYCMPNSSSCQSSQCQSSQCQSYQCQSYGCSSSTCIQYKM